jgi:Tol biopolymer transport system component
LCEEDRIMRKALMTAAVLTATTLLVAAPGANAAFPGENGLIVYQAPTDVGVQLFTMRPDGTDVRQITHIAPRPGADYPGASRPAWSPDGRTIVFGENDCQIALVDADGSNLREVPVEPGHRAAVDICEGDPSFTPDGQSIVYDRYDGKTEYVWKVNLAGTDRHRVTDACGIDPNVSPDGTRLTCRDGDAPGALVMVNMDGSEPVKLSPPSAIAFKSDWAPDGSAIVFSDEFRPGSSALANVATVAPDGSDLRYLTDEPAGEGANLTSYSPDGSSIMYRGSNGDERALFVMAADGSDVRQVTEFVPKDSAPNLFDWGPAPASPIPSSASPIPSSGN